MRTRCSGACVAEYCPRKRTLHSLEISLLNRPVLLFILFFPQCLDYFHKRESEAIQDDCVDLQGLWLRKEAVLGGKKQHLVHVATCIRHNAIAARRYYSSSTWVFSSELLKPRGAVLCFTAKAILSKNESIVAFVEAQIGAKQEIIVCSGEASSGGLSAPNSPGYFRLHALSLWIPFRLHAIILTRVPSRKKMALGFS